MLRSYLCISEVIQVGPLVLAKNVKKDKANRQTGLRVDRFFKKGEGKKFNFNEGGLSQGMSR